ncbi:MAG: hypothetical protein AAYR33_04115 [Acetobacteraceae bacterium]
MRSLIALADVLHPKPEGMAITVGVLSIGSATLRCGRATVMTISVAPQRRFAVLIKVEFSEKRCEATDSPYSGGCRFNDKIFR